MIRWRKMISAIIIILGHVAMPKRGKKAIECRCGGVLPHDAEMAGSSKLLGDFDIVVRSAAAGGVKRPSVPHG